MGSRKAREKEGEVLKAKCQVKRHDPEFRHQLQKTAFKSLHFSHSATHECKISSNTDTKNGSEPAHGKAGQTSVPRQPQAAAARASGKGGLLCLGSNLLCLAGRCDSPTTSLKISAPHFRVRLPSPLPLTNFADQPPRPMSHCPLTLLPSTGHATHSVQIPSLILILSLRSSQAKMPGKLYKARSEQRVASPRTSGLSHLPSRVAGHFHVKGPRKIPPPAVLEKNASADCGITAWRRQTGGTVSWAWHLPECHQQARGRGRHTRRGNRRGRPLLSATPG